MESMIAFCGLNCSECPAYLATALDDNEARVKVAVEWSQTYGGSFKPEDINCDGCTSQGNKLFAHCRQCSIRACGLLKNVANCGHCEDYICDQLNEFFTHVASAKEALDKIAGKKAG